MYIGFIGQRADRPSASMDCRNLFCSLLTARERSHSDSPCLETSHLGFAVTSCPGSQNDCVWASAMDTGSIARIPAARPRASHPPGAGVRPLRSRDRAAGRRRRAAGQAKPRRSRFDLQPRPGTARRDRGRRPSSSGARSISTRGPREIVFQVSTGRPHREVSAKPRTRPSCGCGPTFARCSAQQTADAHAAEADRDRIDRRSLSHARPAAARAARPLLVWPNSRCLGRGHNQGAREPSRVTPP